MTFPYSVQLSHDGRSWHTIAKTVDQHKAFLLTDALAETGHDRVRVRQGANTIATKIAQAGNG